MQFLFAGALNVNVMFQHLEKLYKLCENKVMIPKALIKKAK